VASPGPCILALTDGRWRGEIGFGRFLRNSSVTVAGLCEGASRRTAERVSGREVLAIQDTSEIILGGGRARSRGYGPVGKGVQLGGVLLHPVLAVDAMTGELFGLADIAVWSREKRQNVHHSQRPSADKESNRWLTGMKQAADVLRRAAEVTVVSDRESDIYADFTQRPATVHLLLRAGFNRRLDNGKKLFDHADELAEACRFSVTIAAAPGRPERHAILALRFGPVTLLQPERGLPAATLKQLPASVRVHHVDIREVDAPAGTAPIHWRLLTSHDVSDAGVARKMVDFYRKRWIVEDYFRTLKTSGFRIEDANISDPEVMLKFLALAAIAAVTVTQLLRARDNPSGQCLSHAFDPDDVPLLEAVCADYEGPTPTKRQANPHLHGTIAYAAWVIARLGGWMGYYGKPGPLNLNRGLTK